MYATKKPAIRAFIGELPKTVECAGREYKREEAFIVEPSIANMKIICNF